MLCPIWHRLVYPSLSLQDTRKNYQLTMNYSQKLSNNKVRPLHCFRKTCCCSINILFLNCITQASCIEYATGLTKIVLIASGSILGQRGDKKEIMHIEIRYEPVADRGNWHPIGNRCLICIFLHFFKLYTLMSGALPYL